MGTNCSLKPEHETQVRPLLALAPEQAKLAWERSAKKAAGRPITARLVTRSVRELQRAAAAAESVVPEQPRPSRTEQRQLINGAIGQLLVLISQKAAYDALTEKVEALHWLVQSLFTRRSPR